MTRIRSPNYPTISLPTAIDKVRSVHKAEGKNSIGRESVAKILGFGGLNGASATTLSALAKYGLLEAAEGGEARVTDLAVRILFPHDDREKQGAVLEASLKPVIFK
jgi:hypothetical protein